MRHSEGPSRSPAGCFAGFLAATAFFTRLPVEPQAAGVWRLADSAWAFPLVGAGIGGVAAFALLSAQLIGLASWPAALLSVLAGIVLTGALHEDGLADTADGFCGGRDREEKLAILRDSRQGTYGVLAIVLSVLLRSAALAGIGDMIHAGLALVASHAASRAALPAVMIGLGSARPDGLGATAGKPRAGGAAAAALIGAAIALAALGPARGATALCLVGVVVFAVSQLARRQIGGYTGDVLGALQQVGEIVILLAASAR
jgi:adenosylcobinamide-GDP ribazoletransferase